MQVWAKVTSSAHRHDVRVRTDDATQSLELPAKADGRGSAVNGGELLMLALATCYCNDLYREAARLGIALAGVEVQATAQFPGVGLAARDIAYTVSVDSPADPADVRRLIAQTDAVAEIHNTLRAGSTVVLAS